VSSFSATLKRGDEEIAVFDIVDLTGVAPSGNVIKWTGESIEHFGFVTRTDDRTLYMHSDNQLTASEFDAGGCNICVTFEAFEIHAVPLHPSPLEISFDAGPTDLTTLSDLEVLGANLSGSFTLHTKDLKIGTNNFVRTVNSFNARLTRDGEEVAVFDISDLREDLPSHNVVEWTGDTISDFAFVTGAGDARLFLHSDNTLHASQLYAGACNFCVTFNVAESAAVPLPASATLLLAGIGGLAALRRHRPIARRTCV
jgi:hypothetical protein